MSWDAYISDQLMGSGMLVHAAICGVDGFTWASSKDFTVSQDEVLKCVAAFKDSSQLAMDGLTIAGTRYIFLSGTEDMLRAKKGKQGIHIAKTNTAVILCIYEDPVQGGQCATVIDALAEYLKTQNY